MVVFGPVALEDVVALPELLEEPHPAASAAHASSASALAVLLVWRSRATT